MLLKKGERGLLVGQTGAGKTQNAIFQLRNTPQWPVLIFDTKIEPAFLGLPEGDETLKVVRSFSDFEKLSKQPRKEWPDYIVVQPEAHEVVSVDPLDKYAQLAYNKFGQCFVYFDETYNWHDGTRAVPGLLQLLQRGRSRGKTTLMASQRPSWISRFCLTESQKFYIHRLTDERDLQTLAAVIPNMQAAESTRQKTAISNGQKPIFPRYYFWHFEHGEHDQPELFSPVPEQTVDLTRVKNDAWI